MDQAVRAFHEKDEYLKIPNSMTAFMLNIQSKLMGYIINLRQLLKS